MKNILGLDLGTNSIGWAVISSPEIPAGTTNAEGKIIAAGSRIIPMDAATLSDFDKGNAQSQTQERTRMRLNRRIHERMQLRRERLNRILALMGFLPPHYAAAIDRYGKFKDTSEPKIAWIPAAGTLPATFLFQKSFGEMTAEFRQRHPELTCIPYDWTLYYLRTKALRQAVTKEELAWILHSFNQKRGYYQLRGEEAENTGNKDERYYALRVTEVVDTHQKKGKNTWFDVTLENGFVYHFPSATYPDWVGKVKEFIVTTTLDKEGKPALDKDGNIKRSFRMPKEEDWRLQKMRTEELIQQSHRHIGEYIYEALLQHPQEKIRGKYVRTIDRELYKNELRAILQCQQDFHPELRDPALLKDCANALYPNNPGHRQNLVSRDLSSLLVDDILFYQRPLKSQKGTIADCPYEHHEYLCKETGEIMNAPIKCIARSHPLFQEFRLWQFVNNLRIYQRLGRGEDGLPRTDIDVTRRFLPDHQAYADLFARLNDMESLQQKQLLKLFRLKEEDYRWNYVEDKTYPANETRATLLSRLKRAKVEVSRLYGTTDAAAGEPLDKTGIPRWEAALWHLLYSVNDRTELQKGLEKFAAKHGIADTPFVEVFRKMPPFDAAYGAYSAKAVGKLLPLLRRGSYRHRSPLDAATAQRIDALLHRKEHSGLSARTLEKAAHLQTPDDFQGLPLWLACYLVYDRHSEALDVQKWNTPADIDRYLFNFRQHSLRNPIVEQVVLETLRVVRDIWKDPRVGQLDEIHVELGREMKNPAQARKKMSEQNLLNEQANLRIKRLLMEFTRPEYHIEGIRPYSPSQQELLRIYEEGVLEKCGPELPEDIAIIFKKFKENDEQKQPSHDEILRYRLWLDQQYRSPYTNEPIPLGRLFTTDYQIEHVVPQSLFFDNSYNNKVICEAEVNQLKSNSLGLPFIREHHGELVTCSCGRKVRILEPEAYETFVKDHFANNRKKMERLLLTEVPESFSNRQLNDSRYISKFIVSLLSNIVRAQDDNGNWEEESTSKHIVVCNGQVTDRLKKDWGLNEVWNRLITPRFERLNAITGTEHYGHWEEKDGKRFFLTAMPLEQQRGFNRKRIDHRHHALDAITIACASRNVVNYLSNLSGNGGKTTRTDLQHQLCRKQKQDEAGNYRWIVKKPWDTLTQDTAKCLDRIIVSFKQNRRIVTPTANHYLRINPQTGKKERILQAKGEHVAIRKALHKDTVYGCTNLQEKKFVKLKDALLQPERVVNRDFRRQLLQLLQQGCSLKAIEQHFAEQTDQPVNLKKIEVYCFTEEMPDKRMVATRKPLGPDIKIQQITDSGIRTILENHLKRYGGNQELALSADGIDRLNRDLQELNGGKPHQPIFRVRIKEPMGNKFAIGTRGCNSRKFVVAAKGTNLFFAVYQKAEGQRCYESIPLNVVIDRLKKKLPPVPEQDAEGHPLLFSLSPNDLVYVPAPDEAPTQATSEPPQRDRIYKMVSCSGNRCSFLPHYVARPIVQGVEYQSHDKIELTSDGQSIKEVCRPLKIDKLGRLLPE